ncbi:efflux RND transporter periplasmic adaptor subunit [Marinoscillum sp.]|uniref:efflux RND transporter periplasmic adaptor subunit n=1 Tax=Marinoscillum sp. TaxID=2024838 RepID=UPI003BA9C4CF
MKSNKTIFIVVVLLLCGFIGWKLFANKKVVDARTEEVAAVSFAIPVKTSKVMAQDITKLQQLTGVFEAEESLSLISETQGTVRRVEVKEGDRVMKNDPILKIDDASLQAQYTSAVASYDKAKKDLERYQKLETTGSVSKQQIEEVALVVRNAEANLEAINQQLRFTNVKSPISGFINQILVEEGEFVMSGTKVVEVINVNELEFTLMVSESDLSFVKEGLEVSISTDVYPLKTFTGKVGHISYKADASKKYKVIVSVKNNKEFPLRAGMFGKATFSVGEENNTSIVIPRRALIGSLKDARVYVVSGENASLRSITVGAKVDDKVVVLSGLEPGEAVVTSGQINLTDGAEVRVVNQ